MKPAERIALRESLARAMAWTEMTDDLRNLWNRRADRVLTELEATDAQQARLGWLFVDPDIEKVGEE